MNMPNRCGLRALVIAVAAVLAACGGGGGGDPGTPAPVVATVEILETGALLRHAGETRQLGAVARDAQGNTVDVPIAWHSGKPGVLAVDAAGMLTAVSDAGASQIVASAQGVRSMPLLAVVTEPAAGALIVSDAQVLGEPVETEPDAAPSMTSTSRVTLSGGAAPALGTLVVGSGSKAVAGRVVAVDSSVAGQTTITLGRVPLPELFPHLQIDEVFDLSMAPVVYSDAVLAYYTIERVGNTHTFTPKAALSQGSGRERALAAPVGTRRALGPFECNPELTGLVGDPPPLPVQLSVPPLISITIAPSVVRQVREGRLDRFVVKAEPALEVATEFAVALTFAGKLACAIELFVFPVPVGGALSLALSGLVPVGAGFELSGKLTLAEVKLETKIKASAVAEVGLVDCAGASGCSLHTRLEPDLTWDPKVTLPAAGLGGLRLEPALEIFGTVDAAIGSRLLRSVRLEMLKTKFGGKLAGNFMTRSAQVLDTGYKSDYKLSLEASAGVGFDLDTALQHLGLAQVTLLDRKISTDLATSPAAIVSTDRAAFDAGDTVNLKAVLDPSTFLGLYNVERIEWVHKVGTAQTTIATQPAHSGQTEFTQALTATTSASAGEYYAFVISRLPGLPLELGNVTLTEATPMLFCPNYEVDVDGRIGNSPSRVFNVNAQAGFSTDGAYGGAVLGGNLTLSLTSGFPGTARASGEVSYLAEVDAAGPVDTVWRWSGSSNVNPGGSCSATISVGSATRSMVATSNGQPLLEIPVTVRHGDILKAALVAACTSPGLQAGPPEVLINANIGMSLQTPSMPGVRLRPVMCIP